MKKFINKIAETIYASKRDTLEELCIVLPSKRAGTFFKQALADLSEVPLWMPKIYAIEEWLEEISGFTILDRTTLLFELYISYQKVFPKEAQDSFESFLKWAPMLLTDFNDISAYLDKPSKLFDYLHQAKKIESWTPLDGEPSEVVKKYLRFWELMGLLFSEFTKNLEAQNTAFQGMAYRKASEGISSWMVSQKPPKGSVCYVGFNAMNPCEEHIMRTLIAAGVAEVFWDADTYYLNDPKQEAGRYLRKHKQWPEFESRPFNWVCSDLIKPKEINVIGVPKGVAQAQLAASLINKHKIKNQELKDLALVLADENLLLPVLEFLPSSVDMLNITMGNSLKNLNMYAFFDAFFQLHLNREKLSAAQEKFYFKDLFKVWQHPAFQTSGHAETLLKLKQKIQRLNHSFPSKELILADCPKSVLPWIQVLLNYNSAHPFGIIDDALALIDLVKDKIIEQGRKDSLDLEQLFVFAKLFNQIKNLQDKYGFIKELKTLHHLFQQSAKLESLSFFGEPLSGLQLMGMLETRNLDFEHVILLSANEGFLPEGKTDNSFIPFDIRKEVGLPTYLDKDAIFAYHFYRLAQRCKSFTLVYNTQTDAMGAGEKSRFIAQLENELKQRYPNEISFTKQVLSHPLHAVKPKELAVVKDIEIQKRLKEIATGRGFSPSSLNSYKNCPLQFYYEKVLKIRDPDVVEETIAANTLGTVVHRSLEDLYKPFVNHLLTEQDLKGMLPKIPAKLKELFSEEFKKGTFNKGKNLLVYTVAEQFLNSFIKLELKFLKNNELHIIGLEQDLKAEIKIDSLDFSINLNGNADRIDQCNGGLRITDYKTGMVNKNELQTDDLQLLVWDKSYQKGFQLYLYAYLYHKMKPDQKELETGIVSFRALKNGFIPAGFKEGKQLTTLLDSNLLTDFEAEFKTLLASIFDTTIPFHHKDRTEPCRFCDPQEFR